MKVIHILKVDDSYVPMGAVPTLESVEDALAFDAEYTHACAIKRVWSVLVFAETIREQIIKAHDKNPKAFEKIFGDRILVTDKVNAP